MSVLVILALLLVPPYLFSATYALDTTTTSTASTTSSLSTPTYNVRHQSYLSMYMVENITSSFGLSLSEIIYLTSSATYFNSSFSAQNFPWSNSSAEVQVQTQGYVLSIRNASVPPVSGSITVSFVNNNQIQVSSPAQLIGVTLIQDGSAQTVWSGYLNASGTVSGYAYLDARLDGLLLLHYADGTTVYNDTIPFSAGATSISSQVSGITAVSAQTAFSNSTTAKSPLRFPKRYYPAISQFDLNTTLSSGLSSENATFNMSLQGYKPAQAYVNGTALPAIVWRVSGSVSAIRPLGSGIPGMATAYMPFNATMYGVYGTNGAGVGYIDLFYGNGIISTNTTYRGASIVARSTLLVSSTTIVFQNNASIPTSPPIAASSLVLNNNASVLLFLSHNGDVQSTANVSDYHSVYINSSGALVQLQVNSTRQYVVIFSNNASGTVVPVTDVAVSNSTFNVNGSTHVAQKVVVNGSGYIMFNITLNGSPENITVYKMTSSGSVALDSRNYFLTNGQLRIFDDPSTTYCVVYAQTVPPGGLLGNETILAIIVIVIIVIAAILGVFLVKRARKRAAPAPTPAN